MHPVNMIVRDDDRYEPWLARVDTDLCSGSRPLQSPVRSDTCSGRLCYDTHRVDGHRRLSQPYTRLGLVTQPLT